MELSDLKVLMALDDRIASGKSNWKNWRQAKLFWIENQAIEEGGVANITLFNPQGKNVFTKSSILSKSKLCVSRNGNQRSGLWNFKSRKINFSIKKWITLLKRQNGGNHKLYFGYRGIYCDVDEWQEYFASFHIRQGLGLTLTFISLGLIMQFWQQWFQHQCGFVSVLWSYGIFSAIRRRDKPVPLLGFFQNGSINIFKINEIITRLSH
jgi:hypothetical protein